MNKVWCIAISSRPTFGLKRRGGATNLCARAFSISASARVSQEDVKLTQSGAIMGTPAYMAPEQACGQDVDLRADLFSFGATLYEMSTGQLPFTGANTIEMMFSLATVTPPTPLTLNSSLPPELSNLIMTLLEKDPLQRPQTASRVAEALSQIHLEGIPEVAGSGQARAINVSRGVDAPTPLQAESSVPFALSTAESDGRGAWRKPAVLETDRNTAGSRHAARLSNRRVRWRIVALFAAMAAAVFLAITLLPGTKPPVHEAEVKKEDPLKLALLPEEVPEKEKSVVKQPQIEKLDIQPKEMIKLDSPKKEEPIVAKKEPTPRPLVKGDEMTFDLGNGVELEVVKINAKGKKFLMGSPKTEDHRNGSEEQHEVQFYYDWYMGKYEVTQEQYRAIMGDDLLVQLNRPKNPIDWVSWENTQDFLRKANERFKDRKVTFRLPSEAEWEYACRAGTISPFHYGHALSTKQANIGNKSGSTKSVGTYEPNAFGLYDMHGNVAELCEDYFGEYSNAPRNGSPQKIEPSEALCVYRGGSFFDAANDCRSAFRDAAPLKRRSPFIGFRVVIGDEPKKPAKLDPPKKDDPIVIKKEKPLIVDPPKKEKPKVDSKDIAKLDPPKKDLPIIVKKKEPPIAVGPHRAGEVVEVEIAKGVAMKFCWIPPGKATLGSPAEEKERSAFEIEHEFTSKGFWLGKYEVTQEQWQALMATNPSHFVPTQLRVKADGIADTSHFPVEMISWNDCQDFIKKLNDKTKPQPILGKGKFALPHEDEWEYACRGGKGNKRSFYFGDLLNGHEANSDGTSPYGTTIKGTYLKRTTPVGHYEKIAPHPWHLCDMHGNIWEWCEDVSGKGKTAHVLRGGAWGLDSWYARAACRGRNEPGSHFMNGGCRVLYRLD